MATDLQDELAAFRHFVADNLDNGLNNMSLERAVQAFRDYQRQLAEFKHDTETTLRESDRGESSPLDVDRVVERGKTRLAEKGIVD